MVDDLHRTLEAKLRELDAVNAIGRALTGSLDLKQVLKSVTGHLAQILPARQFSILLHDADRHELVFEVATGDGAERLVGQRLPVNEGIAGWVATNRKSLLVPDVSLDPRFSGRFDAISLQRTVSVLAIPLIVRGHVLGVVELLNGLADRAFNDDDVRVMEMLGEFIAIGVDNARNYRIVEELTVTDEHTSLFNARYLKRILPVEVERARRFSHPLSVIFFDLDRFKEVNDTHGHDCGTAVLAEIADLLTGSLRTVDVPVRYGGDEFVIVLPETLKRAAFEVASRLHGAIGRYDFLREKKLAVHVTGSFGVAGFPEDATDAEGLLRAADQAMYQVKNASRDGICAAGTTFRA